MQRHVAPTNRDESAVWALFGLVGYDCALFIRATQGEIGRTFSSNHLLYIPPVNHYNKDN